MKRFKTSIMQLWRFAGAVAGDCGGYNMEILAFHYANSLH